MKRCFLKICLLTAVFCLLYGNCAYANWVVLSLRAREIRNEIQEQSGEKPEQKSDGTGKEVRETSTSQTMETAAKPEPSKETAAAASALKEERNVIKASVDDREETFYVAVTEKSTTKENYWYIVACSLTSDGEINEAVCMRLRPDVESGIAYEMDSFSYYPSYRPGEKDTVYYSNPKIKRTYVITSYDAQTRHVAGTFSASPKTARSNGGGSVSITGSFDIYLGEQVDAVKELYDAAKDGGSAAPSPSAGYTGGQKEESGSAGRDTVDHTCRTCNGTGKCYICGGDTLNRLGSDEGKVHKCITCNSTGKCPVCHGLRVVY